MSWIREEDLKAIRQQADIVDILSHYLTLTKKGKSYMAVCPFHDDHDPSLSISVDKQIFKCFVCGTGGNVFTFVQKIENITFPEAVAKVAELIGYPLTIRAELPVREDPNQTYYDILRSYIQYCAYELQSEDGLHCMEYLQKRHIHEDIRKRFEIGYAPANQRSVSFFKAKQYPEKALYETGLVNDAFRSVFNDRLMIPIHDARGNPVGFTARILTPSDTMPKYINTGQTPIYEKGNLIFNYHRAGHFARKNKRVILTEGAMDVLAFEKADIHESVACLGTACTPQQMQLLKALRVPVVVCYDGDRAGREATYKFCKAAIDAGVPVQVVKNQSGNDPDEIFEASGSQALIDLVHKTMAPAEFYLDFLPVRYDLDNYEDKVAFAEEMQKCILKTCNEFEQNTFFAKVKSLTGFDIRIQQPKQTPDKPKARLRRIVLKDPGDGRVQAERACLNMILLSKDAAARFREEVGFFKDDFCNRLSYYCYENYRKQNRIDTDSLLAQIEEEDLRNYLMDLLSDPMCTDTYSEDYFLDSLSKIKQCALSDQIDFLNRKIETTQDASLKLKLAGQKKDLIIYRNNLRRKEG